MGDNVSSAHDTGWIHGGALSKPRIQAVSGGSPLWAVGSVGLRAAEIALEERCYVERGMDGFCERYHDRLIRITVQSEPANVRIAEALQELLRR